MLNVNLLYSKLNIIKSSSMLQSSLLISKAALTLNANKDSYAQVTCYQSLMFTI